MGRGKKDDGGVRIKKSRSLSDITNHKKTHAVSPIATAPIKASRSTRKLLKKGGTSFVETGYSPEQLAEQKMISHIKAFDTRVLKADGISFKTFDIASFYQLARVNGKLLDLSEDFGELPEAVKSALGEKYDEFRNRGRAEALEKRKAEEAKKADPHKELRLKLKTLEELCRKSDEFFSVVQLIGKVRDDWRGMLTEEEQVKLAIFLAPYQEFADEIERNGNPFPPFSPSEENGIKGKGDDIEITDAEKAKAYFAKLEKQISDVFDKNHLDRYMPFYKLIVSNFSAFDRFLSYLERKYNKLEKPDKIPQKKDNPLLWLLNKNLAFRESLPKLFQFPPKLALLGRDISNELADKSKSFVDRLEDGRKKHPVPFVDFLTLDLVTQSSVVRQHSKEYGDIQAKEVKIHASLEAMKSRLESIATQLNRDARKGDPKWAAFAKKVNEAIVGIKENTIVEPVKDIEIILRDFENLEGKKKEYKENINQLKENFEKYKEARGDIVLSPFPGYEYLGEKEGGKNRPGEFGGKYKKTDVLQPGEKPEVALFKKEEDVAKVMGEGVAGVMLNTLYQSIGVDLSRVAQVSFVKAYSGSKETRDDESGERVYIKSTFISDYEEDLWKKALKEKHDKKIPPDSSESSSAPVTRSRSDAMSRSRSKVMPKHRPSQVLFKTAASSRYLLEKREIDFVRQFAELAAPRLLIADFGLHDANFGVAKELVALDYGAAFTGLPDKVNPYSTTVTGITRFYKNHFLDYKEELIKSDKMAMVFIQLGHITPSKMQSAIDAAVKQLSDYFTIDPLKAFCKRLKISKERYEKLTEKNQVLDVINDYMRQQMGKRQESIKEQGYMLLLEHCVDSKNRFSVEILKNKLLIMNDISPGLGNVTRNELIEFIESDRFSKMELQLRDGSFKSTIKDNLDAIPKIDIAKSQPPKLDDTSKDVEEEKTEEEVKKASSPSLSPSQFFYRPPIPDTPSFLTAFNEQVKKLDEMADKLSALLAVFKAPAMTAYLQEEQAKMSAKRPDLSRSR